jgi:phosphate starvation-inducible PhoH-like protein
VKAKQQSAENMNIRLDNLITVDPITPVQTKVFEAWRDGDHLALTGTAGTGKTFLALYLALEEVMDKSSPFETLHIIRSVVPTREIGYLPGSVEEKLNAYTGPYRAACTELFNDNRAYDKLVHNNYVSFESTSYIRGVTFDSSIILVDEMQNLNFHELDSVITRVGQATKIIFCGDYHQSDFKQEKDKQGINTFLEILDNMRNFSIIRFGWEDIVRSDFVRDYIMTKEWMNIK